MFVCCREISKLIGKRSWKTYTFNRCGGGGTWYYLYACKFLKLRHIIIFTPPMRKALSKEEQSNTLRTEQNVLLMTIFHVAEGSAD